MRLAIMQPYFFPYIGYFQLINAVDKFMLYENVDIRKKSWMTRNIILPKGGELLTIFVPLENHHSSKPIREIRILPSIKWRENLLNKLFYGYKNAVFFDETFPLLCQLIAYEDDRLHAFNCNSIIQICMHLEMTTTITFEHSYYLEMENVLCRTFALEYKNVMETSSNMPDKKTARIINICKHEGATDYYNAIGGTELYKKSDFAAAGNTLSFIKTNAFTYTQFNCSFMPNLSIIDVLMHCGKAKTKCLLEEYTLI
jgi:hypothetical protein